MQQIPNRSIFCKDNLDILQGINSNSIDLIYLDPPFNKKKEFIAPIGSSAEGASFKDTFTEEEIKDEWVETIKQDYDGLYKFLIGIKELSNITSSKRNKYYLYNYCYLCYMAIRLIEMRRILKETGSIYLHCDPTMSHYIKLLMDIIFGEKNFRNEIVWKRHSSGQKGSQFEPKKWGANTDHIFFYVKNNNTKMSPFISFTEEEIKEKFKYKDEKGKMYQIVPITMGKNKGERPNLHYKFKGISPPPYPNAWSLSEKRMYEEYEKGNIIIKKNKLERRKYLKDSKGKSIGTDWNDIKPSAGKEYTGYPTQKPLNLLERIIQASSNEGDIVLDPFCGCATTCVASEKLNRQWIGIDISHKAYDLVKERLAKEVKQETKIKYKKSISDKALVEHKAIEKFQGEERESQEHLLQYGSKKDWDKEITYKTDSPNRTDTNGDDGREKKWIYIISHPNYSKKKLYKVGIAFDYKQRLSNYQTSDPLREYKIEYKLHTPYFREIEKYVHGKFDNLHEWVDGELEEIKQAIENYKPETNVLNYNE